MARYPYIPSMRPLRKFLDAMQTLGTPKKVTTGTLGQMGFKTSNASYIPPILKFIGFVDESGLPTEDYTNFKKKSISKSVMASALRKAYADLFQLYPDAPQKDYNSLRDFFTGTTDAGETAVKYTVETFKTLCSFADFEAPPTEAKVKEAAEVLEVAQVTTQMPTGVTINLNIQLTLPATEDATVYDKIFKALKENLLSRD